MCIITSTEFKNNFEKYIELGQKEEIQITKRGIVILRLVPERKYLVDRISKYLNVLPRDVTIGNDPDERG